MEVSMSAAPIESAATPTITAHRRSRAQRRVAACVAALALLPAAACAPPFSERQSARLAGVDRVELTGSYGSVTGSADGDSERLQNQYGVQLATGLDDGVDVRVRYERITAAQGE